jgi:hypothetical protein
LRFVDPTGEKATVRISTDEEKKTGTITVKASIGLWTDKGSGLDKGNLNYAANQLKTSMENAWNGSFEKDGITYTVKVEIDVQVYDSENAAVTAGAQNVIELTNQDPDPGDGGGPTPGFIRNGFKSYDSGVFNFNKLRSRMPEHEFGHLLGVDDRSNGYYLMNNRSGGADRATSADYGWAFGSAINNHRTGSRQYKGDSSSLETRSSPRFRLGPPTSSSTTRELRAGIPFWRPWR